MHPWPGQIGPGTGPLSPAPLPRSRRPRPSRVERARSRWWRRGGIRFVFEGDAQRKRVEAFVGEIASAGAPAADASPLCRRYMTARRIGISRSKCRQSSRTRPSGAATRSRARSAGTDARTVRRGAHPAVAIRPAPHGADRVPHRRLPRQPPERRSSFSGSSWAFGSRSAP